VVFNWILKQLVMLRFWKHKSGGFFSMFRALSGSFNGCLIWIWSEIVQLGIFQSAIFLGPAVNLGHFPRGIGQRGP
jgi:hypothetical protein